MYCGQCGTPNEEEAGHCETCGAPLLITTGARTCSNCGGSLGDHDRFCTTCGAAASGAEATETYDAADDFGELEIDDIQLDELPDWLQDMAPSPSPQLEPEPAPEEPHNPAESKSSELDGLPEWLRDSPPAGPASSASPDAPPPPPPATQGGLDHQPADQFSLVTDEDLPDWLKALSDDDDDLSSASQHAPAQAPTQQPSGEPTKAVANLYEVPPVSRAWLTQGRFVDPAQVTAARQEFSPLETAPDVATGQASSQSIWDTGPIEPTADDEETRPFAVSQEEQAPGRGRLIARLVILVLLVIVALLLAYVLMQGV